MITRQAFIKLFVLLFLVVSAVACQSAYYSAAEKFGVHKRDILKDRVAGAKDAQGEAKEEFSSALERFTTVLQIEETELASAYNKLNKAYEASEKKADKVRKRIDGVESVAEALFDEWDAEIKSFSNPRLMRDSKQKFSDTQKKYEKLIASMRKAESRMDPVLNAFHDQVLYLKHNLNAQAVSSLQSELVSIETDVSRLVREMEVAIKEADAFLETVGDS